MPGGGRGPAAAAALSGTRPATCGHGAAASGAWGCRLWCVGRVTASSTGCTRETERVRKRLRVKAGVQSRLRAEGGLREGARHVTVAIVRQGESEEAVRGEQRGPEVDAARERSEEVDHGGHAAVVGGRHEQAAAQPASVDLMHGDVGCELHGHAPWRRHVALEQPSARLDGDQVVEEACRLHTLKGAAHRWMHARVDSAAWVGNVDALAPKIAASLVDQRGGELHPA
eukprot:scaffold3887_cov33-Phaeocystis_antarctica.AAC.1